jgi:hypothetical protein
LILDVNTLAAPAGGASGAVRKWPVSLRQYVNRSFASAADDASRAVVEAELRECINDASLHGEMHTRSWDSMPPPGFAARAEAERKEAAARVAAARGNGVASAAAAGGAARVTSGDGGGLVPRSARAYVERYPGQPGYAARAEAEMREAQRVAAAAEEEEEDREECRQRAQAAAAQTKVVRINSTLRPYLACMRLQLAGERDDVSVARVIASLLTACWAGKRMMQAEEVAARLGRGEEVDYFGFTAHLMARRGATMAEVEAQVRLTYV